MKFGGIKRMNDASVEEYIDFLFDKLNELVIEDISYSDYDQMTDWLGEIRKGVNTLEKKQSREDFFKEMEEEELAEFKRYESAKKAEVQMMEKELKYKVGDKVRLRDDLEINMTYFMDNGYADEFVYPMEHLLGEVVTISLIGNEYSINESDYLITDEMIEGLVEAAEVAKEVDMVNHPPHYQNGGIETLDIIRMCMSKKEFKGYLKGQVIKYRERAQFKGNPEQDYAKARFYYDRLMELEAETKSKKRGKK